MELLSERSYGIFAFQKKTIFMEKRVKNIEIAVDT
jgi:hypothetical protein